MEEQIEQAPDPVHEDLQALGPARVTTHASVTVLRIDPTDRVFDLGWAALVIASIFAVAALLRAARGIA